MHTEVESHLHEARRDDPQVYDNIFSNVPCLESLQKSCNSGTLLHKVELLEKLAI